MTQNERLSLPIWKKLLLFLISIIVFSIQIVMFYFAFRFNSSVGISPTTIVYFFIELSSFFFVLYISSKNIPTSYKLSWCVFILIFPLPFILLYMMNQSSKKLSNKKKKRINNALKKLDLKDDYEALKQFDKMGANLVTVVKHSSYSYVFNNVKYTFFNDAYLKHLDLVEELKKAKNYIFIETFILGEGYLLDELIEILEEKGKQKVEIKILYDDIGSKRVLSKKMIQRISQIENCQICNYEPLGLNINLNANYRNHQKIIVIDGKIAYCGGDNLADEYIHKKERFGYWRDNCGKFEGDIVISFIEIFLEMWFISTKKTINRRLESHKFDFKDNGYIMAFSDGPSNDCNIGYELFQSMINAAKRYVFISTPYLVIDDAMIDCLALKAKSGVEVVILMPGIPDKKSVFYMSRGNYQKILSSGGKIFEYSKGFNHAKNIIVDDDYAFIGTINMDYRSLFLHYECGSLIIKNKEIEKMRDDFINACIESKEITLELWKKRPWYQKLMSFIFNLLSPLL